MNTRKKLLILGGGGVTGKLIVKNILQLRLPLEITIGSRHILQNNSPDLSQPAIKKIAIDLRDENNAVLQLARFDLVIIATGPFKTYGTLPHRLCIKAGVDCIDINDEAEVTMAVYELDEVARAQGVKVMTGMGLNPGLMTWMLMMALQQIPSGPIDAYLRLFIGGKQDAGYAAVHVMLEGFHKTVAAIKNGQPTYIKAHDQKPDGVWQFPGKPKPVEVMHCSTPQPFTLTRHERYTAIRSLDFRIHFQGMNRFMVNLLRSWAWLKKPAVRNKLANMIFSSQEKMKNRKGNVAESIAVVQCHSKKATCAVSCTGLTSYEMTARFVTIITRLMLEEEIIKDKGVMSVEDNIVDQQLLAAYLEKNGLIIHSVCTNDKIIHHD